MVDTSSKIPIARLPYETTLTNSSSNIPASSAVYNCLKGKAGYVVVSNSATNVTINTGLSGITSIVTSIGYIGSTDSIGRISNVYSISGGTVVVYIRSSGNGNVEGVGDATSKGMWLFWIAVGKP